MRRLCLYVAELLEPDERDAVLGDFEESGETAGRALRGLLGLVLRRQVALWNDWRAWLILVGLIVPLGMLLSTASRITADRNSTYIWMYANNWDWNLLRYTEFWYEFAASLAFVFVTFLTLVCWSWTVGFMLGSVSRKIVRACGVLFCVVLAFGCLSGARRGPAHPTGGALALEFYRSVFPLLVQAVLVAVPALWAMRQGARMRRFPTGVRIILWSVAIVALTGLVRQPGFGFLLSPFWQSPVWQDLLRPFLNFIVYWPLVYFAATRIQRGRQYRRTA